MDEIVKSISERLAITPAVAREAIKVVLEFVRKRTAQAKFEKIIAEIPGARALLAEIPSDGGGLLSDWSGSFGDASKVPMLKILVKS